MCNTFSRSQYILDFLTAQTYSCFAAHWVPSNVELSEDELDALPPDMRARGPRSTSLKAANKRDRTKNRLTIWYLLFVGRDRIPDGATSVGFPGDVWLTAEDVQILGPGGWTAWTPRRTRLGGMSHPLIASYKLGYRPATNSLAYAKPTGGMDRWRTQWTIERWTEILMTAKHRLSDAAFPAVEERLKSLEVAPGELISLTEITGGGLAALMFPQFSTVPGGPCFPASSTAGFSRFIFVEPTQVSTSSVRTPAQHDSPSLAQPDLPQISAPDARPPSPVAGNPCPDTLPQTSAPDARPGSQCTLPQNTFRTPSPVAGNPCPDTCPDTLPRSRHASPFSAATGLPDPDPRSPSVPLSPLSSVSDEPPLVVWPGGDCTVLPGEIRDPQVFQTYLYAS